jgi:glycosyltransferase involved in cell wall biosynthesis
VHGSRHFAAHPTYSVVIPICNEEEALPTLARRLKAVLDDLPGSAEVILVDDGSSDKSHDRMVELAAADRRFKVLRLTRNFGHQFAITAGTDLAAGDAIIVMDADLQHPPELIPELIARWREGFEVVYGVMERREGESWLKDRTASLFYGLLRRMAPVEMPAAAGDFRLVDRKALDVFRQMRESTRYVRGMFAWIGFRQIGVPFTSSPRVAGHTKYTLAKMLKLGSDAILSFSEAPLIAVLRVGLVVAVASILFGIATIVSKLAGVFTVPGYVSIVVIVSFASGIQLIVLGAIGAYVARVFEEVKRRPLYVVRDTYNLDEAPTQHVATTLSDPTTHEER